MTILGIDPGTHETAYTLIDTDYTVLASDKLPNGEFMNLLPQIECGEIVIEGIKSYGQTVGQETFHTCYFIGELRNEARHLNKKFTIYHRPEYMHSILGCRPPKGKADSALWQALRFRFGGDKKGEPLHLLKGASDKRSAFAVAVYHLDRMPLRREPF